MKPPIPKGWLNTFRQQNKVTQRLLADIAKISVTTFRRWEKGRSFPKNLWHRWHVRFWLRDMLNHEYPKLASATEVHDDLPIHCWCIAPEHPPTDMINKMASYQLTSNQAARIACHLVWCHKCRKQYDQSFMKFINELEWEEMIRNMEEDEKSMK